MYIPLDIYQHISCICPEIGLHRIIKGVPVPPQRVTAVRLLGDKRLKGKPGRRSHLQYLYSSGNKDAIIDYVKKYKKRYNRWNMLIMLNCETYGDIMSTFKILARIPSNIHYKYLCEEKL